MQVNQWNLHEYVDGECTPPSRDPFWLSANEKPLPDYEAGNDGQDEDAPPLMTNLMSEVIKPKYPQKRIVELKPLWADVRFWPPPLPCDDPCDARLSPTSHTLPTPAQQPPRSVQCGKARLCPATLCGPLPNRPPGVCTVAKLINCVRQQVDGEKLARETLGRKAHDYYWRQSTSMIYLEFKLPEGTSARELTVEMHPTHLTVRVGDQPPLIDEELYMRIYVGSNADNDSSIWEIHDKRVLIFHLVKWHRLAAGNVRDVSRTWWRKCLVREVEFENTVPASSYYEQKD